MARVGVEPTNNHEGLSFAAFPFAYRAGLIKAPKDGFEPTISCVTGRRALQAAPRGRVVSIARVGFEPTASLVLSQGGLPVAYRAVLLDERGLGLRNRLREVESNRAPRIHPLRMDCLVDSTFKASYLAVRRSRKIVKEHCGNRTRLSRLEAWRLCRSAKCTSCFKRKVRESNPQGREARPGSSGVPSPIGLTFRKAAVAGFEPAIVSLTGSCLTIGPHRIVVYSEILNQRQIEVLVTG